MYDKEPAQSSPHKLTESSVHGIKVFEIILLMLILLSVVGVAITDFSPRFGTYYWFAMIPVFAVGCLIIEWTRSRKKGAGGFGVLVSLFLIWTGALLSIGIVYALLSNGRLNYENTGLIILLLLAFATYSAGIILDYRLCLLGISLGLALLLISYLEAYIWVVLILGVAGVGLSFHYLSKRGAR